MKRNSNMTALVEKYRSQNVSENKIRALVEFSGMLKLLALCGDNVVYHGYILDNYNPATDTGFHDESSKVDNGNADFSLTLYVEIGGRKTSMSYSTDSELDKKCKMTLPNVMGQIFNNINTVGVAGLGDLGRLVHPYVTHRGYQVYSAEEYSQSLFVNGIFEGSVLIQNAFVSMFKGAPTPIVDASYSEIADKVYDVVQYDKRFVGTKTDLFKEVPSFLERGINIGSFDGVSDEMINEVGNATFADVASEFDVNNVMDNDE